MKSYPKKMLANSRQTLSCVRSFDLLALAKEGSFSSHINENKF